jgi:hypothetical protein
MAASNSADGEDPWAGWHRWVDSRADARIEAALDAYNTSVGEALAMACNDLRDEIIDAFRRRDEQIAELRGKLDAVMTLLTKGTSADVVPLPGARKHA